MRRLAPLWIVLCAAALGCATIDETLDPLSHRRDLEDAAKRYTQLVRWGEFEAASIYVAEDTREEFLELAPAMSRASFADYERGELVWAPDGKTATLQVTYYGYRMSTQVVRACPETQHWYRDDEFDAWRVRPDLAGLRAGLGLRAQ